MINTIRNCPGNSTVETQKKRPTNPIYLEELPENTTYKSQGEKKPLWMVLYHKIEQLKGINIAWYYYDLF